MVKLTEPTGRPLSLEQKQQMGHRYIAGESMVSIAADLNVSESATYRAICAMGIPRTQTTRRLTDEQEDDVLARYRRGERTGTLCADFGVGGSVIRRILIEHGTPQKNHLRKLTFAQETELCGRYINGESPAQLSDAYGMHPGGISHMLRRRGVLRRRRRTADYRQPLLFVQRRDRQASQDSDPPSALVRRRRGRLTNEEEAAVCELYLGGAPKVRIAQDIGIDPCTVGEVLKRRDVPLRPSPHHGRAYSCNDSFFSMIDGEVKAYWLGFLAADGSITHRGPYVNGVQVTLSARDREHLLRLRCDLGATHPVRDTLHRIGAKSYAGATLVVYSHRLALDLCRYGVVPAKTYTMTWPGLPQELYAPFMRGYVDGDGCFSTTLTAWGEPKHRFTLIASYPFAVAFRKMLAANCELNLTRMAPKTKSALHWTIYYGGARQVARIARFLYDGATIYLPRKRESAYRAADWIRHHDYHRRRDLLATRSTLESPTGRQPSLQFPEVRP